MKDRYLFKAKRIDTREWVEGHLITDEHNPNLCFIGYLFATDESGNVHDTDVAKVEPSTICQCIGITDKNGKLIWENDILRYEWAGDTRVDVINYEPPIFTYSNSMRWSLYEDEVIGNIFDNPELLEVE